MSCSPLVRKQLISIMETFVTAIVAEICKFDDAVVLKYRNGARLLETGGDSKKLAEAMKLKNTLERLTREAADEIGKLYCREPVQAQSKVSQAVHAKNGELQIELSSTEIQNTTAGGDTTHEGGNEPLPETENNPLELSAPLQEDSVWNTIQESPFCYTLEVDVLQNPDFNFELNLENEHVEQVQSLEIKEFAEEVLVSHQETIANPVCEESPDQHHTSQSPDVTSPAAQTQEPDAQNMTNSVLRTSARVAKMNKTAKLNPNECKTCGKTFTHLTNLKRHQKSVHSEDMPYSCQKCGEHFGSNQLLRQHHREHQVERPHACTVCAKTFCRPNHLSKHMTSHSGAKPYICSICGKTFSLLSNVKAHERTHDCEKTFACSQCNATFLTKSYLDSHLKVHSGEKPFICELCGKSFAQKSNLQVHKRLHTGEKPFHCEECGETFAHAKTYKSHKQLHTGEEAFRCEHCGKGFRRKTHLKNHLLIHSGVKQFQCDLCPKTFALKGSLKSHRFIHTGEKNFTCNVCNKTFTQASSLGKHQRIHTGEKPYLCNVCNKSFSQSSHLYYHYRNLHLCVNP